jgi:hypothetical protein
MDGGQDNITSLTFLLKFHTFLLVYKVLIEDSIIFVCDIVSLIAQVVPSVVKDHIAL